MDARLPNAFPRTSGTTKGVRCIFLARFSNVGRIKGLPCVFRTCPTRLEQRCFAYGTRNSSLGIDEIPLTGTTHLSAPPSVSAHHHLYNPLALANPLAGTTLNSGPFWSIHPLRSPCAAPRYPLSNQIQCKSSNTVFQLLAFCACFSSCNVRKSFCIKG